MTLFKTVFSTDKTRLPFLRLRAIVPVVESDFHLRVEDKRSWVLESDAANDPHRTKVRFPAQLRKQPRAPWTLFLELEQPASLEGRPVIEGTKHSLTFPHPPVMTPKGGWNPCRLPRPGPRPGRLHPLEPLEPTRPRRSRASNRKGRPSPPEPSAALPSPPSQEQRSPPGQDGPSLPRTPRLGRIQLSADHLAAIER